MELIHLTYVKGEITIKEDWESLVREAKQLGISASEVRSFLNKPRCPRCKSSHIEEHSKYCSICGLKVERGESNATRN